MKTRIKLRNVLRRRTILTGLLFMISGLSVFLFLFFGNSKQLSSAPATGDYRSAATGNWNTIATWQRYNGSSWVAASATPTFSDGVITIQSGHTVTVTAIVTADQVVVQSGGVLSVSSGIAFTLKKTTSPDLAVYGIFRNAGTLSFNGGSIATYYSGGVYQHNYSTTAGTIPVGTWNSGSTCEIYGYTTNTGIPGGLNQTFDTLKWNCTSQSANVNFAGGMSSFTGNFVLQSTGTAELQMASGNYTLAMTGSVIINGGTLNYNNASSKTITVNQTGDMILNGGTLNYTSGNLVTGIINLTGNYIQTGGTFNFGNGNSTTTSLNITGDFSQTGGTLTTSASTIGQVIFKKTGSQDFTASGNTVTGNVDYTINSGATLNMGTSAMIGRNFTLSAGGELGIGSSVGITSSGSTGNIQVSGTRTFNAGGYYLYNGTSNQVTGNGLPSTINKLTIANDNFLTLTNTTVVSNNLNFIGGKILTGNLELQVTNTAAGAITGNSTTSYVAGNLRRTITTTGSFDFPVGSAALYELMNITTAGAGTCTTMLASFTNAATNDTTYPLTPKINGVEMTEMLDYGYWTVTPNANVTGGSYTLTVNERGYSNMLSKGTYLSLLARTGATSTWQSVGVHNDNTQTASSGIVTAARSGLVSSYQYGIALGDFPNMSNPTLISGTDGTVGATYLFQDAMRGIDLWTQITNIYNGASLSDIDNSTTGYNESFQPFINFPGKKDSYIEWKVMFKKANTSVDTTLKKIAATGIDVDGIYSDASNYLREYIVATMPTSYSLDSATALTMSNDSGRYKAMGPTYSIANIDTSQHQIMYQLNYNNVSYVLYRTGANNQMSSSQTRQTSLIFRSFLFGSPVYALPIELIEFKARLKKESVQLNWITASEKNNDYFTVERSSDGINFKTLFTKRGAGNSSSTLNYEMIDDNPLEGQSYYRLKQTDYDGKFTYSKIEAVNIGKNLADENVTVQSVSPNPFQSDLEIEYTVKSKGTVQISLLNTEGKIVESKKIKADIGSNRYQFDKGDVLKPGTYFVVIDNDGQRVTRKIIKN